MNNTTQFTIDRPVTLESIATQRPGTDFKKALKSVITNILDPHTSMKKRTIKVEFTFAPVDDDRNDIFVGVTITRKLIAPDEYCCRATIDETVTGDFQLLESIAANSPIDDRIDDNDDEDI